MSRQMTSSCPLHLCRMDMDTAQFPLWAVKCKRTACLFTFDCHPIHQADGERILYPSVLANKIRSDVGNGQLKKLTGGPDWTIHCWHPIWSYPPKQTDGGSVWQIRWHSKVNRLGVHLHLTGQRGNQAVSMSVLHRWSGHGLVIHLLSGNKRTDPPLSRRIRWNSPPVWKSSYALTIKSRRWLVTIHNRTRFCMH